jgi:hypothetical protein
MSENETGEARIPIDREAIMRDVISPQIDRLVALGFHNTHANAGYVRQADRLPDVPTDILETMFRRDLHHVLLPEHIKDSSKLVLVVPTLRADAQAKQLHYSDPTLWNPYSTPDEGLPHLPYAIEISRGDPTLGTPSAVVRKSRGLGRSILHWGQNGNLETIQAELKKTGMRGLSAHEVLAYAREHPEDSNQIHGIKEIFVDQASDGRYEKFFPTIARVDKKKSLLRSPVSHKPNSMAEILYTKSVQTLRAPLSQ